MRYLMLVCGDENLALTEAEASAMNAAGEAWAEEMTARGVRVGGSRLALSTTATAVRRREGKVLVSDGPFAETKEQVGGYDLLECADLDEALEVAAKHPVATIGTIELRPLWDQ